MEPKNCKKDKWKTLKTSQNFVLSKKIYLHLSTKQTSSLNKITDLFCLLKLSWCILSKTEKIHASCSDFAYQVIAAANSPFDALPLHSNKKRNLLKINPSRIVAVYSSKLLKLI